jgi:hypothetical protein
MFAFYKSPGFCQTAAARRHARISVNSLEGRIAPAVFTVTNTLDSGSGSLRQAVLDSNALPGADTINFNSQLFSTNRTITLTSGELLISDNLSVVGPGANVLTISGNNVTRVFDVHGSTILNVSFSSLTITKGISNNFSGGIAGYGADLTIQGCVITGNKGYSGGGIGSAGLTLTTGFGFLTLTDCQVSNNTATSFRGGGIWEIGGLVLQRSTILGNVAADSGGGAFATSSFVMDNSTVTGNSSGFRGGGLYVRETSVSIRNSTISGNTASQLGGALGIANLSPDTAVIQNSTITANSAANGAGGINHVDTGAISIEDTIVSGNTSKNSPSDVINNNTTFSFKNSAIGSANGLTMPNDLGGNLPFGSNLKLGPIGNYGGPTQTIALLAGSPCINAGSVIPGTTNDQRGYLRTYGSAPEIGAYEVQPARVNLVVINDGSAQRSRVTSVTVNFDSLVTLPSAPANALRLQRQSDGQLVSLAASVVNSATTSVTLTFPGSLSEFGSLQDGRYTLTVFGSQVSNFVGSLDGNGDSVPGDDYVLASSGTTGVFRLFGDVNGDGAVSASDLIAFRQYFGGYLFAFDFDGDGSVSANDFVQFRLRFGGSI